MILQRWSSSLGMPSMRLGLNRKLLVSISNTVQASDQISVLYSQEQPSMTSGARYSRVWISSVKWWVEKQALPISTILKKSFLLSSIDTFFHFRIPISTSYSIFSPSTYFFFSRPYLSSGFSRPSLYSLLTSCGSAYLEFGSSFTLSAAFSSFSYVFSAGCSVLGSVAGGGTGLDSLTDTDWLSLTSSSYSPLPSFCFFLSRFFSFFFLVLLFLEVVRALRYFMLMGLTLYFLILSISCASSSGSILIMIFSGFRSVWIMLQCSCKQTSPISTSMVIFLTSHRGMRSSLNSQCWIRSSKLGPKIQNTEQQCLPWMPWWAKLSTSSSGRHSLAFTSAGCSFSNQASSATQLSSFQCLRIQLSSCSSSRAESAWLSLLLWILRAQYSLVVSCCTSQTVEKCPHPSFCTTMYA